MEASLNLFFFNITWYTSFSLISPYFSFIPIYSSFQILLPYGPRKKNFNGFLRSKILEFIQIKRSLNLCSTYTSNNHLYGYNFFLFYSILLFHSTFPSSCCLFFFPLFSLILSSIFYIYTHIQTDKEGW